MKIMYYFELKFGAQIILCFVQALPTRHCEPFLLSLRAEGVAISHEGHYYSNEIAEPVPSKTRNLVPRNDRTRACATSHMKEQA